MRTLTPDPLLPAPGQVSLVHARALPDIPSPPTPCASAPAMLPAPGRLGPRFACPAIGGSSDFAHCSQSRQSHMAVSSLCCGSSLARQFYGLSVHFRLLSTSRCRDAVTFSCLAGSTAREGLSPSGARSLPSARARTLVRSNSRTPRRAKNLYSPHSLFTLLRTKVRAPPAVTEALQRSP